MVPSFTGLRDESTLWPRHGFPHFLVTCVRVSPVGSYDWGLWVTGCVNIWLHRAVLSEVKDKPNPGVGTWASHPSPLSSILWDLLAGLPVPQPALGPDSARHPPPLLTRAPQSKPVHLSPHYTPKQHPTPPHPCVLSRAACMVAEMILLIYHHLALRGTWLVLFSLYS